MEHWQLFAVGLCIAWAMFVVVRRAIGLRRSPESAGCATGCQSCPSHVDARASSRSKSEGPFVALDSLHSDER